MSLITELKRRNVLRVAAAYAVLSWLLIQMADTLGDTLDLPGWTGKLVVMLLVLGLVPTLIFSWVYELTPEGLKKESEVSGEQSVAAHTAKKLDVTVIILLLLAIGLFGWSEFGRESLPESIVDRSPAIAESQQPAARAETGDRRSVAVLPFTNRSAEANAAFFVDGIHDDLLTQLAKISALKVISRTSVLEYRDTTKNLRQIGQELGVSTIMEGAVQRAGDRVRINAQLIDAETDEHLWAETFDRELTAESIFDVQSNIARAIAKALEATLTPTEEERLDRQLTNNLDALAAYQRARQLDDVVSFTGNENAILEARRAVELDPQFTAAWAFLARLHLASWWSGNEDPQLLEEAWRAIETGRAIDPESLELRIAEGYFNYWGHRRYEQALELLEPALEIAPNDADLHEVLAYVNRRAGHFDQAVFYILKAHELNPRSIATLYSVSETYALLRQQEKSEFYLRKLEELAPTAPRTYQQRAKVSVEFYGDYREAAAHYGVAAMDVTRIMPQYLEALVFSGQAEKALDIISAWEPDEIQTSRGFALLPEAARGNALLLSGRQAEAITALEKALSRIDRALAEQPDHFGYLLARCEVLGNLGRGEIVGQACQRAFDHFYDDAMDRNLIRSQIAAALALGGDPDAALTVLELALSERAGPTLINIRANPRFASLHGDPRWLALKEPEQ